MGKSYNQKHIHTDAISEITQWKVQKTIFSATMPISRITTSDEENVWVCSRVSSFHRFCSLFALLIQHVPPSAHESGQVAAAKECPLLRGQAPTSSPDPQPGLTPHKPFINLPVANAPSLHHCTSSSHDLSAVCLPACLSVYLCLPSFCQCCYSKWEVWLFCVVLSFVYYGPSTTGEFHASLPAVISTIILTGKINETFQDTKKAEITSWALECSVCCSKLQLHDVILDLPSSVRNSFAPEVLSSHWSVFDGSPC